MTRPTALAAPVEEGMILLRMERPVRQSLPPRESTAFCLAVAAWMVDMSACSMPNSSLTTLARGAKQLVVHEALETTFMSEWSSMWFTPMTNVGVTSSLPGAVRMTFFAPPLKWREAFSVVL